MMIYLKISEIHLHALWHLYDWTVFDMAITFVSFNVTSWNLEYQQLWYIRVTRESIIKILQMNVHAYVRANFWSIHYSVNPPPPPPPKVFLHWSMHPFFQYYKKKCKNRNFMIIILNSHLPLPKITVRYWYQCINALIACCFLRI